VTFYSAYNGVHERGRIPSLEKELLFVRVNPVPGLVDLVVYQADNLA
jgi:hypothetical protein